MYEKKTCIQMYEKKAYKIAYKCMTKTRIQMYEKKTCIQMYEKKAYKIAYKCMTKTREYKCFWGGVMTVGTALVVCSAEGGGRKG